MSWSELAITLALAIPLLGAAGRAVLPPPPDRAIRWTAVAVTGAAFAVVVAMTIGFDFAAAGQLQYEARIGWIEAIGNHYHVAADGISLPLFFLTYLLTFLCAIYTLGHMPAPGKPKGFLALMLLLQVGMAGTFVAFDLILFFIFWELVLVPMYFMIGIWGGPRREYASIKFFLYTLLGSIFMLIAFIAVFFQAGAIGIADPWSIPALSEAAGLDATRTFQILVFAGMFLGFAIKVPMWPFHTWLPDAHTEAPTVGSVLLAGVLLKMGTYGFIRIALPILPDGALRFAPVIGVLAVIGIIYGSLCCLAQTDVKRLIAFSSVGHMGFVMLGIAAMNEAGIQAALFGNIAHGVITGMLFFMAGSLHDRYHTREIAVIGGGMLKKIPRYGVVFAYVAIASLGLPGLAGFWGEMLALLGAYRPHADLPRETFVTFMVVAALGALLTAAYFLRMLAKLTHGPPDGAAEARVPAAAVSLQEYAAWTPLIALTLLVGLWPKTLQDVTTGPVRALFGGG
jgi:NADH-quinone oxidoreductase subunit M